MNPLDQLGLFVDRVEQLRTTRAVRGGLNSEMSINYHRMHGMQFRLTEPDEEDIRSFLLTFRQFVSEKEPVFVPSTYNICHKHISKV